MKIAFYAPLKSPFHPVPSGDRLMARLLVRALEEAGHRVDIASQLRSFSREPERPDLVAEGKAEVARLAAEWQGGQRPDLWLTYHPYYKAPDFIGPALARQFGLAYVTVEASYSARRNGEGWAALQQAVADAVQLAAVNICFTRRDHQGLEQAVPEARLAFLPPFIDGAAFALHPPEPRPNRLITVAMMRDGDKLESYRALATMLSRLRHEVSLTVIGDGPKRGEVEAMLAGPGQGRVTFTGECSPAEIAAHLSKSSLYVWPGCGEAYGLAYLEAQAAGLPVVAFNTAGVPEVVQHEVTGLLTPQGEPGALANAVDRLLEDHALRRRLAQAARRFALEERSLAAALGRLDRLLEDARKGRP